MVGVAGSGKDTWIKNHISWFAEDVKVVSRDQIRFALIGDGDYFSKEKEVWKEFVSQIKDGLRNNIDTIVNATHLNTASRTKLLRALGSNLAGIEVNAIVINVDVEVALAQNENRKELKNQYVPRNVIHNMASTMTIPELEEGFNNIFIFSKKENKINYYIKTKGETK
jgi:predicted kinase